VIVAIAAGVGVALVAITFALTRWSLEKLAYAAVGFLLATITWNGIRIFGGAFGDGFLALAAIAVLAHVLVDRHPLPFPPWLAATAAIMVLAWLVTAMHPPSQAVQSATDLQFTQLYLVAGIPIPGLVPDRSNLAALLKWEIPLLVIPIAIMVVATSRQRINRLLDLWTVGCVINAFFGVLALGGIQVMALTGNARSAGLAIQPNYLALTSVFGLPPALRWVGRSQRATVAGLVSALLLIGGAYTAGSRDGVATILIALVLSLIFMPRLWPSLRYVLPALGIVIVAILAFTREGQHILNQLRLGSGATASTYGSDYQRSIAASVAKTQFSSWPLSGVGFAVDNDAQNIYLQIIASGGIILAAGILVYLLGLASAVVRSLHGPVHEEAIAIGICMVAYCANGYFDAQLADKYLYALPGILAACAQLSMRLAYREPLAAPRVALAGALTEPVPAGMGATLSAP
jgi:hypothetical protein